MIRKILFSLFFFSFFLAIANAGANTQSVTSDRTEKDEIKPFIDGLNVVTKLNPIRYIYNGKANSPKGMAGIGLIAQDIKDIAPYAVIIYKGKLNPEDKEETLLFNFNSAPLTFVLINSVKEQQTQIEAQQKQIEGLKTRVANLESKAEKRG